MSRERKKSKSPELTQIELGAMEVGTMNDDGDIQLVDDMEMFNLDVDNDRPKPGISAHKKVFAAADDKYCDDDEDQYVFNIDDS